MASLELCHQLVQEAAVRVSRTVSAEDVAVMARSWHRAFVHTSAGDLESAFNTWFDHGGEDEKLFALPTSGAIQVHLTNLFRTREAIRTGRDVVGPKPVIRPEFAVAHLAFRGQVKKLGEAEPKSPHHHPRRADGSTDRTSCRECERIDRVQLAVLELEAKLPAPKPSPRICPKCEDGRGWVQTKDGSAVYPCSECNGDQFSRWLGQEMAPDSGMGRRKKGRKAS